VDQSQFERALRPTTTTSEAMHDNSVDKERLLNILEGRESMPHITIAPELQRISDTIDFDVLAEACRTSTGVFNGVFKPPNTSL
jgi:hypothetical protein